MQNLKLKLKIQKLFTPSFIASLLFFYKLFSPNSTYATSSVVINEFYTPTSSDWVELYNTSDITTDISNWYLKDSTSNIYTFPASSSIGSHAFLAVDVSNRLNKDGDTVTLHDNIDQQVDNKAYSSDPSDGISIGRYPDGDNWTLLQSLTKGSSNNAGNPVPTVTPTPIPTNTPVPSSSPTNTPAPTSGPTSTPKPASPTPTKKPTSIPTLKPTESEEFINEESSLEDQLLGASTSAENIENPLPTSEIVGKPKTKSTTHLVPIIVISLGVLLMLAGSAPFLIQYLKTKTKSQ